MTISHSPIVAATALALAALLAACSPSAPTSSRTASASPAPAPMSSEAAYLAALRPLGLDGTDAQSISLAHTICADLDAHQPMSDLIASIVNTGTIDEADTRVIVRAAIVNYCPSHKDIAPAA